MEKSIILYIQFQFPGDPLWAGENGFEFIDSTFSTSLSRGVIMYFFSINCLPGDSPQLFLKGEFLTTSS